MKFTDLFILRPVIAIVIIFLILIAGIQALYNLNVRQYPRSDNSIVNVKTSYVGANVELIQGFITSPLERVIAAADGIEYMESQSSQGLSNINVYLKINYDPIKALAEISAKIDQIRNDLPPESEVPIISIESADSKFASAYLSFTSDVLKQNEITDYLVRSIQPRLIAIPGVQRAEILGARTFAMRIWLKPELMAAFNITPTQVSEALVRNNFLSAIGSTKGSLIQVNLTTNTDLRSVSEFERIVVKQIENRVVRLEDIANVELGAENYDTEVKYSGKTAVFMGIWSLPNANSLEVIKRVRLEMDNVQKLLPSGMQASVAYDATSYIDSAIKSVVVTLIETLVIVGLVIFLFLGSIRTVIVPLVAIPVSLIGALFIMQLFGFTINLLTLLAIVLSVGLVVDDAIVVVENVERHVRNGLTPINAALKSARELISPIIAMTITLAAVYLPIGLQGGLTGSLFREFAFTLAGAVTISGVVALVLSPMMSSRLIKPASNKQGFADKVTVAFENLKNTYSRLLDASLRARPSVYLVWIVITMLTVPMYYMSPKELAPTEDQGVIFGIIEAPANSTLELTSYYADAANEVYMQQAETSFTFQLVNPTTGFSGMVTKAWDKRDKTVFQILPQVQQGISKIPNIQLTAITPPALPGGGQFPVEFVLGSTEDIEQSLALAKQLQKIAMQSGKFAFPPLIDVKIDQPQAEIILDRDRVSDLGLDLANVGEDTAAMVGGNFVNRFNISGRSYKVIPQINRVNRLTPEQLKDIYITGPDGQLVQLGSIATIKNRTVARSINRLQQLNAVKISGVAIVPLDEALRFLEDEAAKILPQGYVVDYTGESRQLRKEGNKFLPSFGLAIVLIFLVLAAQFNSFRDPLVILIGSVPLAMFGALVFTFLKMPNPNLAYWTDGWTTTLNIYSQVGLVTLIGLISKNGILIVQFANQLQLEGLDKLAAVKKAATIRLRPILMISVATIAGHFPLTLVSGAGAEARNSIGLVLVGGMFIGTLFTLFIIPSIYMLLARDHTIPAGNKNLEY
jgi:multidrug efflux pump